MNILESYPPLNISTDFEPLHSPTEDSPNSLFDEVDAVPAALQAPPIPGLFFMPTILLPVEIAHQVTRSCLEKYFSRAGVNQIMLFGEDSFSPILLSLLSTIASLLKPSLPPDIYTLLFPATPTRARQAILNLYHPGEGITAHVDLLKRFGDGIVGVSFGSSCVMRFARASGKADSNEPPLQLFLPERSMIVLTGEARYGWTHGIEKKTADLVADGDSQRIVERGMRLSITFRWLLPGADVVGEDEGAATENGVLR